MLARLFAIAVLGLALAAPALADPLEDAAAAAYRGDYGTAAKLWRPLADGGNAVAQNNLGSLYGRGLGVKRDDAEAVRLFRLAAEQGLAAAESNLGFQYEMGLGVDKNLDTAFMWYQKAAAQDFPAAQFSLGLFYEFGWGGVQKDQITAYMWLALATANGVELARNELSKVIATMSPEEFAEGRKRQIEWRTALRTAQRAK